MGAIEKYLLIALVVWIVWRFFARKVPSRQTRDTADRVNRNAAAPGGARPIEDMVKCPKCGAYVPASGTHHCEAA